MMPDSDLEAIRHALTVARAKGFAEVELEVGDLEFSAKLEPDAKRKPRSAPKVNAQPAEEAEPGEQAAEILSSLVGYYRPAEPPLEVGREVSEGEVVAVIAALGLANEVESPVSGEVLEVLVEANQPVEYGQVLAKVKVS